jgi:hypothetical protein
MKKTPKPEYSIAMSKDTGCIVMIRTNGKQVLVVGSLTREESLNFVRDIMEWSKEVIREDAPRIQRLNG